MSRGLEARLRKAEAKTKMGDDLDSLSDEALFAHSRAVADAFMAYHGSLEVAQEALREEGSETTAAFIQKVLACKTVGEFMGYSSGWERYAHMRSGGVQA